MKYIQIRRIKGIPMHTQLRFYIENLDGFKGRHTTKNKWSLVVGPLREGGGEGVPGLRANKTYFLRVFPNTIGS